MKRITLRVPENMVSPLEESSKQELISINSFILHAVRREIERVRREREAEKR